MLLSGDFNEVVLNVHLGRGFLGTERNSKLRNLKRKFRIQKVTGQLVETTKVVGGVLPVFGIDKRSNRFSLSR